MIFEYCQKAIEKAEYKKLDDGTWYAEVPGFRGVWANAETVEDCRKELISVLEEWIVLKLRDGDAVPEKDRRHRRTASCHRTRNRQEADLSE